MACLPQLTEEMRRIFRAPASARGLWAGEKAATHQDLSAYFAVRSIELYLRPGGRFGFVMPLAVLSRLAYAGFREGKYGPEFGVAFDEPWDCEGIKPALVPVPSSVVFGRKTDRQARGSTECLWTVDRQASSGARSLVGCRQRVPLPDSGGPQRGARRRSIPISQPLHPGRDRCSAGAPRGGGGP